LRSTSILLLLALALPLSARGREYAIRPAPPWVERLEVQTAVAVAKQNVRWGIYDILRDHQTRVTDSAESQYFRTVRNVLSPSGVENASELELDFDPTFETLVLHEIALVRGATRIDALAGADIRVIDKEDDSESRIYDGERTALIFLRDVRPGDVIDYSWSLDGANPILGGKYTDEYDLSSGAPVKRMRHRLLWPAGRPLQWRGLDPAISNLDPREQQLVWERTDVRPLDIDDSIPAWYEPWESVQITEFASWSEVAQWSAELFVLDARSVDEVKQLAARIIGEHATREERITAAIRFVQDDIRYLGIEMGRNSHEPHQPWETLEARWGDCKDKTLLLVALLRELGLNAHAALVSTRLQHRIEEKLPSPFVFDHVIARVIDAGRTYWIDGTIAEQGGTLQTIETPSEARALIVDASTTALTEIHAKAAGMKSVEQTYTTTDYGKPTKLTVKTTYTGSRADDMRSYLSSISLDDYANDRINNLAADQPKIEALAPPSVRDDRKANVIVITETYELADLWADGNWTWYPRLIESYLTRPDTMIRTMPLKFAYPLHVSQSVTFNLPEEIDVEELTAVTETSAFRHEYRVGRNGNSVWIKQSLRALRDHVAVKDVPEHLTKLNAIASSIGYRLVPDGAQPKVAEEPGPWREAAKWLLALFLAGAFVAVCFFVATRKRVPPPFVPQMVFRPGEAPVSALSVRGAHEIDAHLAGIGCSCGAPLDTASDIQRARYAEREMTIVTRRCRSCGREQSVYFTAA
jgi:Domain of Unknown Function with PDB structure (DUF3857)/Transglutaminase-like superfamily